MMPPRSVRRTLYLFHESLLICACLHHTAAKGSYVHDVGLLGFAMWNAAEDYDDILVDAISEGAGISC